MDETGFDDVGLEDAGADEAASDDADSAFTDDSDDVSAKADCVDASLLEFINDAVVPVFKLLLELHEQQSRVNAVKHSSILVVNFINNNPIFKRPLLL